jgi:hypothetical protein
MVSRYQYLHPTLPLPLRSRRLDNDQKLHVAVRLALDGELVIPLPAQSFSF